MQLDPNGPNRECALETCPVQRFHLNYRHKDFVPAWPEACVAPELIPGEKLPKDFEALQDIDKEPSVSISLVSRNKKRTKILFEGDKITLEGYLELSEISVWPFITFTAVTVPRYSRNEELWVPRRSCFRAKISFTSETQPSRKTGNTWNCTPLATRLLCTTGSSLDGSSTTRKQTVSNHT